MRVFLFALLAFLLPVCAGAQEAVRVTVRPQQVYIERASSGQLLNFDFLLENLTADKLRITAIRVRVFDGSGRLVVKRSLDDHGLSPAIETVPQTEPAGRGPAPPPSRLSRRRNSRAAARSTSSTPSTPSPERSTSRLLNTSFFSPPPTMG